MNSIFKVSVMTQLRIEFSLSIDLRIMLQRVTNLRGLFSACFEKGGDGVELVGNLHQIRLNQKLSSIIRHAPINPSRRVNIR